MPSPPQPIDANIDILDHLHVPARAAANITRPIYASLFQKRDEKAAAAINAGLFRLG